jgi:thymidylate synthase (FAD)
MTQSSSYTKGKDMTQIKSTLIAATQPWGNQPFETPEGLIAYCARVSNPKNQDNPDYAGLLRYCVRNKHWSVFEMSNAVVEVEAPRDITRQLLRHRSFLFQEFSQRYSDEIEFTGREFRRQDDKNRQNSIDDLNEHQQDSAFAMASMVRNTTEKYYKTLIKMKVAKECARVILPEGMTMSRLYVNGTFRSWLHYIDVRDDVGVTQWEHVMLARAIRKALEPAMPIMLGIPHD